MITRDEGLYSDICYFFLKDDVTKIMNHVHNKQFGKVIEIIQTRKKCVIASYNRVKDRPLFKLAQKKQYLKHFKTLNKLNDYFIRQEMQQ